MKPSVPVVHSLVLCDYAVRSVDSKITLAGIFTRVHAIEFPLKLHSYVYVAFADGRGRMPGVLRIVHEATRNVCCEVKLGLEFRKPLAPLEAVVAVNPVFTEYGTHLVELEVMKEILVSRALPIEMPNPNQSTSM